MSRPGYVDRRGNWQLRKKRKVRLLAEFDTDLGPDQCRCYLGLSDRCLGILDIHTVTPDRLEPGSTYAFEGLQPACHPCQSVQGGLLAAEGIESLLAEFRAVRDHWEVQFDLNCNRTYRPGVIAEERRKEKRGGRREVTDWLDENPPPVFRDFLVEWHAARREQAS